MYRHRFVEPKPCESDGKPMTGADEHYDPRAIQDKWQARWAELNPFAAAEEADDRERRYALDMFPYPSGDLHMGHAEAFAIGDVVARYRFQRGHNVLHPIGWDSFGLPAENAAIKRDSTPRSGPTPTSSTQAALVRAATRMSFDWSRRLHTSDPDYYRWTQWLFLRFYERGLAYRKAAAWSTGARTTRPCWPTSRWSPAGVSGAVRRSSNALADPVVLQDHRVRDRLLADMAQLEGMAGPGAADAAQLDRPLRGRRRRTSSSRAGDEAGHRLHHPAGHAVRRDVLRGRRRRRHWPRDLRARAAGRVRGIPGAVTARERDRAAVRRPGEDRRRSWAATRSTRSTASGSRYGPRTTCWRSTGTARSWRCPRTTSATWTSRAGSACRYVSSCDTGEADPA